VPGSGKRCGGNASRIAFGFGHAPAPCETPSGSIPTMDSVAGGPRERILACFAELEDPREDNARHKLHEVLLIGLCACCAERRTALTFAVFAAREAVLLISVAMKTAMRLRARLSHELTSVVQRIRHYSVPMG